LVGFPEGRFYFRRKCDRSSTWNVVANWQKSLQIVFGSQEAKIAERLAKRAFTLLMGLINKPFPNEQKCEGAWT